MSSTKRIAELIPVAQRCTPEAFFEEVGGHLLAGPAPDASPAEDASTTVATVIGSMPSLRAPLYLGGHEAFVIRQTRQSLFGRGITIGRSSKNDVCIPHDSISKTHARVRTDKRGGVYISDTGSSNGTQVNGAFVNPGEEVELQHKDEVKLGSRALRFYDTRRIHDIISKMVPEVD